MELRCANKKAYNTSVEALSALQRHNLVAKENGWAKLTGYYCCEYCKLWHTSSLSAKLLASQKKFHEQNVKLGKLGNPNKTSIYRKRNKQQ